MLSAIVLVFVITYAAIALEHPLRVNKSATALLGAGLLWTVYAMGSPAGHPVLAELDETLSATAQIVFFLMGAMTIVEVVDAHNGFDVITARIHTTRLTSLLWLMALVTFVLSAILDNLTSTIVMVSLLRKVLGQREDRLYFAGVVVIAANAGGAWSPIGDVTTTMLWIGGQITPVGIVQALLLASLLNLVVPMAMATWQLRGRAVVPPASEPGETQPHVAPAGERNLMLGLGLGVLLAVPAFKTVTHLPPFLGVLLGLGLVWLVGDRLHRSKTPEEKAHLSLTHALTRIDMESLVFFIGILLAVATLEHTHLLRDLAGLMDRVIGRQDVIVVLIGLASAVVDNVPLVAASMGMYDLATFPPDSFLWEFIAYCAGTGGSILIIGSAAGVAAMGLEHIAFGWYLRRISPLALAGYLVGAATYVIQYRLTH